MLKPQARVSERWANDWAKPDYSPGWRVTDMPTEVQAALSDQWFPSDQGKRLLDLGCGDGVVAAQLTATGLDVLGVDVAAPAIDLARERFGVSKGPGSLTFEVADATQSLTHFGMFDAVLDRGCFHNITPRSQRHYAEALAAVTVAGAPALLVCHTRNTSSEERIAEVTAALRPHFTLDSTEEIHIADRIPGVAIRLRRTG